MKKLVVCLIGLVILSGMTMGKDLKLELKYEEASAKTEMTEPAVIDYWESPWDKLWWSKRTMEALNEENFDRFYLKASYSFFDRIEIYGKIGALTVESTFFNPAIGWTSGYGDRIYYQYQLLASEQNIQGTSKMGFLGGTGINITFLQKNEFRAQLKIEYVYQVADTEVIIEKESVQNTFWDEYWEQEVTIGWNKKNDIQKLKFQKTSIGLILSQKKGDLTISGGPEIVWIKNKYEGGYFLEHFAIYSVYTEWNWHEKREQDFEFKTRNVKKLSGFMRAEYLLGKNTGIFVELRRGAENTIAAGLTINL